ncbi:MAG: DUF1501 domain-containing protein [Pirellulales bacterium]|nr:DUF1501 domain-containing protein [Pirellulales bacterium]
MLTIYGPRQRYCDGLSRRSFLRIGAGAVGGLLAGGAIRPQLFAGDSIAAVANQVAGPAGGGPHKALIMVYLSGGLAHQDSFDPKPDAPAEARGEFAPISTRLPGVQFTEHLPRLAAMADKLVVLRSIVGQRDEHSSFQTLTGYPMDVSQREGRPNLGSVVARVQGATSPIMPPFVDLFPTMQHRPYNSPGPGVLGRDFAGVKADGEDLASMKPRFVSHEQMRNRRALLGEIDRLRHELDAAATNPETAATDMDPVYRRAFDVLDSNRLVDALDLAKEYPQVRERYAGGSANHQGDGAPLLNEHFLMARRLVEAGVRVVTVAYGFWDTHGNNFGHLRGNLPVFDAGISTLIDDLHARGLDRDVTVCVWGEFGRTPKINANAGRDHWAPVNGALLAGGGLRTGQVVGSTDKLAAYALERPIHFHDVLATLYDRLGISLETLLRDAQNRPQRLLPDTARVIGEIV